MTTRKFQALGADGIVHYTNPEPVGSRFRCSVPTCRKTYDTEAEARSCAEKDHRRLGHV